ncbi:MAG: hypothetical protein ABSG53_22095 [Thermoguttaceae bacterium]|jgi:hypothetical protein
MAKKQFRAFVKPYNGKDPKKKQYQQKLDLAERIEAYINAHLEQEARTFPYYEIAEAIGSTKDKVRDVLSAYGGGSGEITF